MDSQDSKKTEQLRAHTEHARAEDAVKTPGENLNRKDAEIHSAGKGILAQAGPDAGIKSDPAETETQRLAGGPGTGLPHERDQSSEMTADQPDPRIQQAAKDIGNGLKDTSRGAETDKAYEKFR